MSEMAKKARSEMRAKAVRLAGGGVGSNDPYKPVDASSWAPPPDALDAGRKTGARPIRPRIYKHGGHVQFDRNPGKAPRKRASGGRAGTGPLSMINTADENKRDFGSFHEGGYKNGGSAGKPHWIKDAVGKPGALHKKLGVPEGKKIPAKKLAKAEHSKNPTEAKEANLAKTLRSFHAKGGKVDPAAHEKGGTYYGGTRPEGGRMPHAHGGRAKGKTNINIVIAQPKAGGGPMGAQAMPPQGPVRPPMPPPQMAPPAGGPPPMPPPGMGGPPGGMPPGAGPMMRKSGGRTTGDAIPLKDYGSNSGLGRLEKVKIQERSHR
jgi:hypothetical protein